jgi:UDP-N-acetylmuramoyl-tripeptide--D-alanyl-D-alanine ligase
MAARDRMRLPAGWIAERCGGALVRGTPEQPVEGFSTDTRTLHTGDLFIALRGERFDGNQFVAEALDRGASGAIVDRTFSWPDDKPGIAIAVPDALLALHRLASAIRVDSGTRVVAITGSAGKTTTKEVTAEFLSSRFTVFRNRGNLNNHIGLPLSLLELRHRPDIAVVELGMNHPGEIRTLVRLARPDVRVWTNVGDAHLGFFGSPDAIADAKAEILEDATAGDVVVANADDARVAARASRFAGEVITFGIENRATVQARDVQDLGTRGMQAMIVTANSEAVLRTPLLGRGNLANVLAAAAVALHLGVSLDEIVSRATTLSPAHHRGEVVELANGVTIIDDSYNSSPSALVRALDVLARSDATRKAAVLGEMLELGSHATALHESCGATAARAGLAWLITVGGDPAAALAQSAARHGMTQDAVLHVPSSTEAAGAALARVRRGDLVLIKGSRGIGTDRVVERLKEAAAA